MVSQEHDWAQAMKRASQGTLLLGAAVGGEEFVVDHYLDLSQRNQLLLKGIREMKSKQCAFFLLRHCANTKLLHITRLSPPSETERATSRHDSLIEESLASLLGAGPLSVLARKQARLKTCNGGLGLTSVCEQRESAFLFSWSKSLQPLLDRVPGLSQELEQVVDPQSDLRTARELVFFTHSVCSFEVGS